MKSEYPKFFTLIAKDIEIDIPVVWRVMSKRRVVLIAGGICYESHLKPDHFTSEENVLRFRKIDASELVLL
jgi:hypothetical protein